jgi:BirA family biotin operon repressor/biotin-[acetyl-CoA-carboxylase] ligase
VYKIPAGTLFLGKNLVYVPHCTSTNILATELGQKPETPEGTLVVTDHQSAGRGQRGNKWESQPGKNLTFSLILKPRFLSPRDQFKLNEAISLAIAEYLSRKTREFVQIKWPNDIYIEDRKVCGILIENHVAGEEILYSVVGIGLNVNQHFFPYPRASSLKSFTGIEYELERELSELAGDLESRYLELRQGKLGVLEKQYLDRLYQRNKSNQFSAGGKVFEGVITGVNDAGQLTMKVGDEERIFGAKEVVFL